MNPAPDFLNYSPEDVLTMGREMNLEPEALASGLLKHRANVESYGRETAGDPEKFWKGAVQLDKDTDAALEKVRMNAERQALTKALPDQADHVNLAKQLEAGGYDPTQVDEKYHPALEEMKKVRESAAYQMPQRIYGGAIKVGETPLARYALREGSDGQMDVSLQLPDDSQALLRVPKATEEDVKQALVKKREAVQAAFDEEARIRKGMAFDPLGKFTGRDVAAKQRLEAARQDYFNLGKGREKYLMGEYIREELKKPEWADKIGQYAGGTEFVKGLADASISAGALVARIAGDENAMRRFAQGQAELDTALPGSTRRRLEGGVWNDSVSGAQRALGNMAPSMVAGGATRLITGKLAAAGGAEAVSELARQQAGRLGVAGASMSAGATGNAYLDTQRQIDAAEANGDQELADRLRMGRDMHAILTGVAEGAVERLGAAQAFNVGKGTLVRTARELGMEALEEPITGGIQRGLVNPVTLGQREDVTGPMLQEALTGLMAAGPLVGGSVAINHLTGQPVDASQQAPGAMPQAPRSAGPIPVTPAGGTSVSPLGDIAAGTFVPDPGVVSPGADASVQQPAVDNAQQTSAPQQAAALPMLEQSAPAVDSQQDEPVNEPTRGEDPTQGPHYEVRRRAAEAVLKRQGVEPEVAAVLAEWTARNAPADISLEQLRDELLSGFEYSGGVLPDSVAHEYSENIDTYLRTGRTQAQAEQAVADAIRHNDQLREVAHQKNRELRDIAKASNDEQKAGFKTNVKRNGQSGRQGQGGFTTMPHVDALFDLAHGAVKAGKTFAAWAGEMIQKFGDAVRSYLGHVWAAAKRGLPARRAVNTRMGGVQRGTAPVRVSQIGAVDVGGGLEGVSRHVLLAKRGEREVAQAARLSLEEKASLAKSAAPAIKALKEKLTGRMSKDDRVKIETRLHQLSTVKGLKELEAEARAVKLAHPMAQGWAPMELSGVNEDGGFVWKGVNYGFNRDNSGKSYQPGTAGYDKRVKALAVAMSENVRAILQRSLSGDVAAEKIISQASWYKAMRTRLRREFGGLGDLFADLLGATSPNTPVRDNWSNAVDVLRRSMRGDFDALMPEWVRRVDEIERLETALRAMMTEGLEAKLPKNKIKATEEWTTTMALLKAARKIPDSQLPMKESGKKYGFNGRNVIRALVDMWRVVKNPEADIDFKGTAPKAINFSGNLIGFRGRATIDVWAARMLQRLAGRRRLPAVTEGSVEGEMLTDGRTTKAFGFGQDVFAEAVAMIRQDSEMNQNEVLSSINDDDLQALVWFIEKEIWSVNNWTSAAGEGGSFEFEADLTGTADQAKVKELRRIADSTKSTPQQRHDALADLNRIKREVTRYVGGLSIQQSMENQGIDFVPADADMVQLRQRLETAVYESNPSATVVGMKALSSEGRYGAAERAIDMEVVGRADMNVDQLWSEMQTVAAESKQDAAFLARVLSESETVDLAHHRPGVEIYFRTGQRGQAFEDTAAAVNALLQKHDLFGFTVVVSPHRTSQALTGGMPDAVGLRLISLPEFSARYGDESWNGLDDNQLRARMLGEQARMNVLVDDLTTGLPDVSLAKVFHYEVDTRFSHEYSPTESADKGSGSSATGRGTGEGAWQGRALRSAIAAAGIRLDAPSIDAESRGFTTEPGEISRRDTGLEQAEPTGPPEGFKKLNTGRNSEAGFTTLPHVDALFDMATAAVQAGKKFTAWAREMVSRFGEAIRDYLTHIWMAAKEAMPARRAVNTRMGGVQRGTAPVRVSQSGAVINPFDKLKGGSNIFHTRGEPFRVNSLAVRQILTGSPLPGELVPVLAKTQNEKRAIEQRGAQVGNDLKVSIDTTVDRTGMPAAQVSDMVSDMLNGTPGADVLVAALDPVLHERTRSVRVLLDNLSAAVAQTLPNTPLRATIVGNLGSWLRRSYAAFDPASGWNYDKLLQKAAAGERINGKDAADILNKARRYLRMQPGGPHPASEIEADLRDLMDRNVWEGALMGGAGARKSVSSLMQRKDIAPEIRAVMGEENNPVKRVSSSLSFQAQFIARHHGQMAMRQVGLASELFSTQRGGVYTQEIPVDGPRWSGLGGTWTTPQLWQALQNAQGVTLAGTDLGGLFVETLKAMGNEAKLNRVAMNPDSWLVNMLGNFMSMVQNGDVFSWEILRRIKEARGTVAAGKAKSGAVINAAAEALHDTQRDMMARLTEAGVLGSSLTLADIEASLPRHLLQWLATDQTHDRIGGAVKGLVLGQSLGRGLGLPGRAVGGVLGAAGGYALGGLKIQGWQQRAANVLMTGPDALARTTGWLTNYEAGLASGMTPDAASDWSTTRTLNTYPNYAALLGLMREGSRLGILGTFIAFQHEVYRNFGWTVRYASEELRSGNPALVERGAQRLAGIVAIGALAGGGLAAILALTGAAGGDDERNKLFRKWYGAPWEKDAVLSFKDFNDKGVTYFNTSYLLPQMTMMELLQAAREGATPEEGAARVMDRLYEQFIGGSVHLGPLLAAATNTNRAGRKITYQEGVAGALERADYPLETIMEPGFAAKVEKIVYALRGAEKNGKAYSVVQEFKRLIGLREQTKTWPEMALGAYRDLAEENANIRMQANKEISLNRPGASARAVTEANAQLAALRAKVAEFETDSVKLGVPMPVLMSAKREANLSIIRDVGLQVDGKRVRSLGR